MSNGLTLEQLKAAGAKPTAPQPQGLSLQQLQAMGAKPTAAAPSPATAPPKTPVSTKITDALGFSKTVDTLGSLAARAVAPADQKQHIPKPTMKDIAGAGLNIAATVAPTGAAARMGATTLSRFLAPKAATVASQAGISAGAGYAYDVGHNLEEGQSGSKALSAGLGTVLGAGIPLAAAATPLAGKLVAKAPHAIQAGLTNVRRDVFQRASDPEWAPMIERAIGHVSQNQKQPFYELASRTSQAINAAERRAGDRLAVEKNLFKRDNKGATFDVASKYEDIAIALKPFRSSGLVLDTVPGPRGSVQSYTISMTPQSSFSAREVEKLNQLLGKIKASKEVEVDDLLSLRQAFSTAYDEIPLGVNGNPRPYHAAVMSLKQSAEDTIDKILPPGLKEAFGQYRRLQDMKDAIGNKIIDGQGELKDTAEQFLSNLGNINKGNVRTSAEHMKSMTGIDIVKEVQAVKDAQALSSWTARTGDRQLDVMRAVIAPTIAGSGSYGIGSALTLAATSPKLHGKAALSIAKLRGASRKAAPSVKDATRKIGDYVKNVQPGLSIKATNPFDDFHPDDRAFLTRSAEQIKAGKLVSQKDWVIMQDTMKKYGYSLPANQKKAAEFILTSESSAAQKAFDLEADTALRRGRLTPGTIGDRLRDELGRFRSK